MSTIFWKKYLFINLELFLLPEVEVNFLFSFLKLEEKEWDLSRPNKSLHKATDFFLNEKF